MSSTSLKHRLEDTFGTKAKVLTEDVDYLFDQEWFQSTSFSHEGEPPALFNVYVQYGPWSAKYYNDYLKVTITLGDETHTWEKKDRQENPSGSGYSNPRDLCRGGNSADLKTF